MYKISIWLKGGGKIVEECDISRNTAQKILSSFEQKRYEMCIDSGSVEKILRSPLDELPIIVKWSEIAAIQIDENKRKEYHGRRLEGNSYS